MESRKSSRVQDIQRWGLSSDCHVYYSVRESGRWSEVDLKKTVVLSFLNNGASFSDLNSKY